LTGLRQVRRGEWTLRRVLEWPAGLEADLRRLLHTSPLPGEPDQA
jgi:hypothetical protein